MLLIYIYIFLSIDSIVGLVWAVGMIFLLEVFSVAYTLLSLKADTQYQRLHVLIGAVVLSAQQLCLLEYKRKGGLVAPVYQLLVTHICTNNTRTNRYLTSLENPLWVHRDLMSSHKQYMRIMIHSCYGQLSPGGHALVDLAGTYRTACHIRSFQPSVKLYASRGHGSMCHVI